MSGDPATWAPAVQGRPVDRARARVWLVRLSGTPAPTDHPTVRDDLVEVLTQAQETQAPVAGTAPGGTP